MPTYTFIDDAIDGGWEWDEFMSISEKEKFLKLKEIYSESIKN